MCLIAFALKPDARYQLVLIANRDEFHARPTAPLSQWAEIPELLAGRDIQAQGTWLGVSTRGRLAAVTNVRLPGAQPPGLRSRGRLALDYLTDEAAPQAWLAAHQAQAASYGPCNLLLMDHRSTCYGSNQPGVPLQVLTRGIYGLSNATLDSPWPKTLRLKRALTDWLAQDAEEVAPLFAALADETRPPDHELPNTGVGLARERYVAPAFIRGAQYGTRCSTVVVVRANGEGTMTERCFGPDGVPQGETQLRFQWP